MLVRPRQKVKSQWSGLVLDNQKGGWICEARITVILVLIFLSLHSLL